MSLVIFLIVLLVLVLVHEFGHFIVAKRAGIRVDEFAFGFPPRLFTVRRGETNYSFNALPLGGYVKIYGENPLDVTDDPDRSRAFGAKPRYVQAAVIVAGVLMNLVLAWALIAATLMIGIDTPVMDDPRASSPRLMVTAVPEGTPAANAGVVPGDVLLRVTDGVDSVETTSLEAMTGFIGPRENRPVTLTVLSRSGDGEHSTKELSMIPVSGIVDGRAAIGVSMDMVGTLKLGFIDAVVEAFSRTTMYTKMIAVGIADFISSALVGRSDFSEVTGPVGIVKVVGQAAEIGIANVLLFTALISINLAVINLAPFPALDGGRLLFVMIEAILRRPIPPRVANTANLAGFSLLMLLMLLVTYHDIVKLM